MIRQQTTTQHTLEIRKKPSVFTRVTADAYQRANLLAYHGRALEAIEEAQRIRIREWGDMKGADFRVVSVTTTVSMLGPWDEFE